MRSLGTPVILALSLSLVGLHGPPHASRNLMSPDTTLVLREGTYLDVRAGMLRPNGAIVVRGGRIVEMHAPGDGWRPPADARVPTSGADDPPRPRGSRI
jgi:hypothetical protein